MAAQEPTPSSVTIRSPTTYDYTKSKTAKPPPHPNYTSPPVEFLTETWSVTHSTLPMWRSAKNVHIAYKPMPTSDFSAKCPISLIDEVSSIPTKWTWLPQPKTIKGISSSVDGSTDVFDWKGQGWLKIAGKTRWEVLGWGETVVNGEKEKWVITWFKASRFTPMGLDFYSSRKEGMTRETYELLKEAVERMEVQELREQIKSGLFEVAIEH